MIAKQYTINLPADYDMSIIRNRVDRNGRRFDAWPGLGFKAFLITERSAGASANRYAPFYWWSDTDGLNQFLYGDGFAGLATSFGRPRIEHWIGLDSTTGDADTAGWATRQDITVPETGLDAFREAEQAWLRSTASDPGLCVAVVAVDPWRWQAVRFALWANPTEPNTPDVTEHEVLHLAAPTPRPDPSRLNVSSRWRPAGPRRSPGSTPRSYSPRPDCWMPTSYSRGWLVRTLYPS